MVHCSGHDQHPPTKPETENILPKVDLIGKTEESSESESSSESEKVEEKVVEKVVEKTVEKTIVEKTTEVRIESTKYLVYKSI